MSSNLYIEVDLGMNAKLNGSAMVPWSKSLFSDEKAMASQCSRMQSPGLALSSTALLAVSMTSASKRFPSDTVVDPSSSGTLNVMRPLTGV